MRVAASILAMTALSASLGACRSNGDGHRAGVVPPRDEVWLRDEDLAALHVTTEEVKLEDVDATLATVGPVVAAGECPARLPAASACVVVGIEQTALANVHVGGDVTVRVAGLVHDAFEGNVAWIAGALDPTGRTVKLACAFPDSMGELHPGQQVRVEVVVGARPAFVVSLASVVAAPEGPSVFVPAGTSDDGRHRFARVAVHPDGTASGPWLPITDLKPGSVVVKTGAKALASMLAVTPL